jgi:hypothetical protein
MTARRQHFVSDKPRRRRSTTPAPLRRTPHQVSVGTLNTVTAFWRADRFGALDTAAWLPSLGVTPEVRISYLVTLASGYLRQLSAGRWDAHLDSDHDPHALIMTRDDGECDVLALSVEGRLVRVGREPLSMAQPGVGSRLLELLSARFGAWFGEPA